MLTLITGGEVYAPEPKGNQDILLVGDRVGRVGKLDAAAVRALGLPCEVVDASGCIVAPGIVDNHSHLIGTAGEQGFASRTSDVPFEDLAQAGITTVVGCLGTDDSTRHVSSLVARARQLQRQGISAFVYTGSFHLPPPTLTGSVRDDLIFIPEVVGIGELAIADFRSTEPSPEELARLASSALVGGLLGEKAGVVHLHVGPGKRRLSLLHTVVDQFEVPARHLYPTHVHRSNELLDDAIALVKRGAFVDFDCIDEGVEKWVRRYFERGGHPERLTLSSDAHAPRGFEHKLRDAFLAVVTKERFALQDALALVTLNPAMALKLPNKGRLREGADADVLVMDRRSLELRDVFARGRPLMRQKRLLPVPDKSFEER